MSFKDAVSTCHVRAAIYRIGQPEVNGRKVLYGKNHQVPLEQRVPIEDQQQNDWEEWDPEEDYLRG